ncbi:DUF7693 family protein [Pseudomonas eucalypticola]|uniref:DUF7693 domain-containing protein n=1 Tax=Pseudomonas eucalypticola TaxID=2599595 RepID=A0A7D5D8X0_9PSED|nr:hypothetical protein [Pseudomonas eucalypticola]QKZ05636.1 hypothetical protein HWQ56_18275 [Pseudomonas eucalypticola]
MTIEPPALTARDVAQLLREAVFGRLAMSAAHEPPRDDRVLVTIEGWRLTLDWAGDEVGVCTECLGADGRRWQLAGGDRYGTDPVALLSTWEHGALGRLLKAL